MWFAQEGVPRIGRISTAGEVEEFAIPSKQGTRLIVSGADGNLWFTSGRAIGSISPSGATGEPVCVENPDCSYRISALATGPEGQLWYATGGRDSAGGGGTQIANAQQPGTIGIFAARPLAVRFGARVGRVHGRYLRVPVRCTGGVAGQACSGSLRLTGALGDGGGATVVIAARRFRLAPTKGRRLAIRLRKPALDLLAGRGRLLAHATAISDGRVGAQRTLVLRLPHRR